ncbi:MAG TPA: hypothetical protein VE133_15225, partial [Candidatus Sulfotelmatobacter sp.]|nr:hypothetical protein [Candidatus Sulfotelmatobacter sp.]
MPFVLFTIEKRSFEGPVYHFVVYSMLLLSCFAGIQSNPGSGTNAQQSAITIHVSKSGLFSGLAHNHIVVAPVARAAVDPSRLR